MNIENIKDNKPEIEVIGSTSDYIEYSVAFYKDTNSAGWGSDSIIYQIIYNYKSREISVVEVGSFGDGTLVRRGVLPCTIDEFIEALKDTKYLEFKDWLA